MSKKKKPLVPELRFPEFRDSGGWNRKPLNKILIITDRKVKKPDKPYTRLGIRSHGKGAFLVFNEQPDKNAMDYLYEVKQNDLIVNITFAWEGAIAIVSKNDEGALVSHRFPTYVFNDIESIPSFFQYLIIKKNFIYKLGIISPGGAGRNRVLNKTDFLKLKVNVPQIPEQQKIADCLTSLDELITAEAGKLAAYKSHKKGLMQKLFPAEGENVPEWRFPEFRGEGEWKKWQLGQCLTRHPEYGINAPAVTYSQYLPTYLRITDISEDGRFLQHQKVSVAKEVSAENYLNKDDIVLARTGGSVGKAYMYKEKDGRLVFAGFLIRVIPDSNKLISELLFQFLSTEQYWHWVDYTSVRSGQPGINGNEYASMPLPLPPTLKEQQRIADCLSSLDNLITAQVQKIDMLKTHKKALMQGLFPSDEEVDA